MKLVALTVLVLVAIVTAQDSGQYRPPSRNYYRRPVPANNDGRYTGGNDGRYQGSNDGRYHPDESGRYAHQDYKYVHQDVGGGQYSGDSNRYQPDSQKKYTGGGGGGGGGGAGAGAAAGTGTGSVAGAGSGTGAQSGSGSGSGAARIQIVTPRPIVPSAGSGLLNNQYADASGQSNLGVPTGLKQGSATGKYDNRNYAIIRQVMRNVEDGYHYLYETENGILAEEQGRIENRGTDAEGMRAHGFFTYTGPDAIEYTVTYTADENGFIPQGVHIPTPPPIPDLIAKALAYKKSIGELEK